MGYGDYLRKLLAPLAVYELRPESVSGAALDALGTALDAVYDTVRGNLLDAFPQTARADALTQWERALPRHGDGTPAQRQAGITHLLAQEDVCCSAARIEAALAACGIAAALEMDGTNSVRVTTQRTGLTEAACAELGLLVRAMIPAHLGITWQEQ